MIGMICIHILKILDSIDRYSCRKNTALYDNFSFLSVIKVEWNRFSKLNQ